MASMTVSGFDEFAKQLAEFKPRMTEIEKKALYKGAGMMADAVRASVGTLPYDSSTVSQILNAIGIANFQAAADGLITTAIGFDGYFEDSHFPIPFFMREVEMGTSRIQKRPVFRQAVTKNAEAVKAAIADEIQRAVDAMLG